MNLIVKKPMKYILNRKLNNNKVEIKQKIIKNSHLI